MDRSQKDHFTSSRSPILQDTVLSCLGSLAAFLLVRWVSTPIYGFTLHLMIYLGCALVLTLIGLVISGTGRQRSRYVTKWTGERILMTVLLKSVGLSILLITGLGGIPDLAHGILAIVADALFTIWLLFYPRSIVSRVREEGQALQNLSERLNALVFGDDDDAARMAESAEKSGHYNILGLLTRNPEMSGKVIGDYIIYFAADDTGLEALQWRLGGIDCILFPKGGDGAGKPRNRDNNPGASTITDTPRDNMSAFGRFFKRSCDLVISGILLIVFSPLIAICSLAVLIEDGRPVLYTQERIGRGGRPFQILKFRSMRVDAEAKGVPQLYSGDDDPRLTRVGKFLRQHHLDELPQLWNVFRGDMSFIGYRPERQYYIDKIMAVNPRYRYLYQIRPGVTSYATLYNGYTDTLEKMLTRLDLDLYYLRHHSVAFDIRVLGMTFLRIVFGKKF